jgi:hypothetical protein
MANLITDYWTLVSAVIDAAEDDSAEFRAYIPVAVGLAEDRLSRELDSQLFINNTTIAVTSSNRFAEKPSGYRLGHHVTYKTSSGDKRLLRKRTPSFLEVYWPYETSTAEPVYYADYDVSTFVLAPTPDDNSQIVVKHEAKPSYLTSVATVNHFTEFYPNLLFYAAMSETSKFRKAWSQVQVWDAKYMENLQAANNEGRRSRRDGTEPLTNPEPVNNTLKNGEN